MGWVSMPYNGPIPFLRGILYLGQHICLVSMPYNGPIPFLPQRAEKKYHALSEVSMPYNGPIPFLRSGLRSCINTGFPRPLLRVIHRIF